MRGGAVRHIKVAPCCLAAGCSHVHPDGFVGITHRRIEAHCYTLSMDDNAGATSTDTPRPVATAGDNDFTLSIEQVSERYAASGHPRTIRSLQRYCASGHLDAQKIATTLGDKYLVTPLPVARHIAQIQELSALDSVATRRDEPRPVGLYKRGSL